MGAPDWIINKASLTGNYYYPLSVEGINLNCQPGEYGHAFSWRVPMPSPTDRGDRYDFTGAEMNEATRAALRKAGVLP